MSDPGFPADWERRRRDRSDPLFDFHDGICDLDAPMLEDTPDRDIPWVVLFADVDPNDRAAMRRRRREWRELFG